ncbi:MAG: uracil-DNA glycosylase [Pseudomonadota bacterium]
MTQDTAPSDPNTLTSRDDLSAADALAALDWFTAVGVDILVQEDPIPWSQHRPTPASAKPAATRQPSPNPAQRDDKAGAPLGTAEAVIAAQALAAKAETLDALRQGLANFDGLSIVKTAQNLVFSDGQPGADLMIIGEAPGREEDEKGLPFVGKSGQLLDRILAAIGHTRENTYISNIVNWRPPGNRKPTPGEIDICRPFIAKHIALAQPKIIVLMGDTAGKALLPVTTGITKYRGQWHDYDPGHGAGAIPAMASFHPAFLLRSPARKREVWLDFLQVKARLSGRTAS